MTEQSPSDRINNIVERQILIDRVASCQTFAEVFIRDYLEERFQDPELINLANKSIFLLGEIKDKIK